jgi:hypothetical protein
MPAYFIRHWRGELPLAIAWWINGVALALLLLALDVYGAALGLAWPIDTRAGFSAHLLRGLCLLFAVPAWQVVGIFRAAERHATSGRAVGAARLVQVLTTVLSILMAIRLLIFAGESVPGFQLAYAGRDHYRVTLLAGDRMLEVRGGFVFGLADDVARVLDASPRVRRLRLESGGGSLNEARRLRALIVARGLDTDSRSECSSACVSAFMGGRHRSLHRAARIGLHLPRNPGFGAQGPVSREYARELGYFRGQGVPEWFIERWIASGRRFWYPTPEELRRAGIVHVFYGRPRAGEEFYFR